MSRRDWLPSGGVCAISSQCSDVCQYKIGPFSRFDEHLMFQMCGKNLNDEPSSRMCISINTDDMGIFQTSLEMEYATNS